MRIVGISDTHCRHRKLQIPECELLIHAGDWSYHGTPAETRDFALWLNDQPAKDIIVVPGNHEEGIQAAFPKSLEWITGPCPRAHVLIHEYAEIAGLKIFGSAYTPWFHDWAYNAGRTITEAAHYKVPFIGDLWKKIPEGLDILITHGPAYDILDEVKTVGGDSYNLPRFVGCVELRKRIAETKPALHIFGHIHSAHGEKHQDGVSHYNVSVCDEMYSATNPITRITYER